MSAWQPVWVDKGGCESVSCFTKVPDVVSETQVKPYNVYVTVAYPPDTDTPGFAKENQTKVSMPLCAPFLVLNVGNPFSCFLSFRLSACRHFRQKIELLSTYVLARGLRTFWNFDLKSWGL